MSDGPLYMSESELDRPVRKYVDIENDWVEKAARAMTRAGGYVDYTEAAKYAIAAVADDIRAQTLRDAADAYVEKKHMPATMHAVAYWLRARAEEATKHE